MQSHISKPLIFLDIDDVLCLNSPYSGFDVVLAFRGRRRDRDHVIANAFSVKPVAALQRLQAALGHVSYVISSSWRLDLSKAQFEELFCANGLDGVANCLEHGDRWRTQELTVRGARAAEISSWVRMNGFTRPYVVFDDQTSGEGLYQRDEVDPVVQSFFDRVVLCEVGIGLTEEHVDRALFLLTSKVK